ncbi:MAG: hypothetical protein DDT20_00641 [Firmicutes bacterium]|nr:hypothetical protein [Bacillota bacterium]
MTKVIAGLLVVLVGLLGSALATQVPSPSLTNLERAFAATGAARLEISMNGWAELRAGERTQLELEQLLRAASQAAFGVAHVTMQYTEEPDMRMASVAFTAGSFHVEANVQVLHAATYLVATVRSRSRYADIWALQQALASFFAGSNVTPTITACLVGVVAGRLSPAEAQELVGSVLRSLAADMLGFYSDGSVVNLTAFSRMLPAGLFLGGRKTNLSLSMRYNEQDGNTWVWLVWPTCAAII